LALDDEFVKYMFKSKLINWSKEYFSPSPPPSDVHPFIEVR